MVCMPWNEIDVMTEKERFIALVHSGRFTTTELCADFGISRKTGHKYLKRYQLDGRKEPQKGSVQRTAKGVSNCVSCKHKIWISTETLHTNQQLSHGGN